MSLFYVQKLLYGLNRDPQIRRRFESNPQELLEGYELSEEELRAIRSRTSGCSTCSG